MIHAAGGRYGGGLSRESIWNLRSGRHARLAKDVRGRETEGGREGEHGGEREIGRGTPRDLY